MLDTDPTGALPPGEPVAAGLFDAAGLIGGHCPDCDRSHFPKAPTCPWCGEVGTHERRLSTHGVLWSWTSVDAAPPGYDGPVPFGFGVVELPADGLRVVTRLTEPDPGALRLGQPMRFTVVALQEGTTTWAFTAS